MYKIPQHRSSSETGSKDSARYSDSSIQIAYITDSMLYFFN